MKESCRVLLLCATVVAAGVTVILLARVVVGPPRVPQADHLPRMKGQLPYRQGGESLHCNVKSVSEAKAAALGFKPLSQSTVEGVEKFVVFVGYQRSGHTLIGSVMDAHPNMLISNTLFLLQSCAFRGVGERLFENKTRLFNTIYRDSYLLSKCGARNGTNSSKGYSLEVNGQWQGKFSQLRVVGEKSGGSTALQLRHDEGITCWKQLVDSIGIPIVAIHVVRNPYDMIATNSLYRLSKVKETKANDLVYGKLRPGLSMLTEEAQRVFKQANSVERFSKNSPVVEIHIEDYIRDPKSAVLKICNGLGLPCPEDYVQECYNKAYRSVSRSRDLIEWEPEVINSIQENMKKLHFFHGYTFEDSFRH